MEIVSCLEIDVKKKKSWCFRQKKKKDEKARPRNTAQ